jgi:hypothetical protein
MHIGGRGLGPHTGRYRPIQGFGDVNDIGHRVVAALGEPAARELLEVLERSDADRAALIARLDVRDDAWRMATAVPQVQRFSRRGRPRRRRRDDRNLPA